MPPLAFDFSALLANTSLPTNSLRKDEEYFKSLRAAPHCKVNPGAVNLIARFPERPNQIFCVFHTILPLFVRSSSKVAFVYKPPSVGNGFSGSTVTGA